MSVKIKVGIIGGSGLDDPDILKNRTEKKVTTIFGPPSDNLILGEIDGVECVLLARHARKHNIHPGQINYRANIWALKEEGCTHIIASNATGSLDENIKPGDLVIADSFIDRTTRREQTFYDGKTGHAVGICHLPMEPAFCTKTRNIIIEVAESIGITVHKKGTIVCIEGPRFSSLAESHMHRQWGGNLVGMTSVPEVILAKEAGICYAAIMLATDYDCWRSDGEKVTALAVLAEFKANVTKVTKLFLAVVPKIAKESWDSTIKELKDTVENAVLK